MADEPIRLMIVDDHASFTESLREVLGRYKDIEVVATAATVAEAVRVAAETRPRVILMDQRLPDGSGSQAAARVLASGVETSIVMLTGGGDDDDMLDAVQAGVSGYLLKAGRIAEVVDAVRRVAAGELLIPAATLTQLLQRARERARANADRASIVESLTARERSVLQRMATPDDVTKISETLGISKHTARGYMQTIIEKLGAHSRLEAVLKAQELGMLGD
jgi:DNA-binding NarL/FixJ family response regulator